MSGVDIGPKISIEGEKQFKESLKMINSQIKASSTEIKALSSEYDINDDKVRSLTQKQQALADSLSAAKNKVKVLTGEYERQRTKLKELESSLKKTREENGEGSEAASKAEIAYTRQATAVNHLESQINIARTQVSGISKDLDENSTKLKEAESRATKYGDAMKAAGDKISKAGTGTSNAGGMLTLGLTAPLVAAGIASMNYASDAEESANKVDVAFGSSADAVEKFAESTVDNYGISRGAALDMAALFGDMGTSMEIPQDQAAEMATSLVGLSGDIASFKNIGLDTAQTALKGIFTGETESLKNLGIVMTETNLKAWAIENGFLDTAKSAAELEKQSIALEKAQALYNNEVAKGGEDALGAREAKLKLTEAEEAYNSKASASWDSLSQSEKVMLRYKYVMEQTKNAQGDYVRTADGTANSLRTMQESGKELAETFGKELLPEITPLIQDVTKLMKGFTKLDDSQKQLIIRSAATAAAAGPVLKIVGTDSTGVGKLTSGLGGLVKDIGKLSSAKKAANQVGYLTAAAAESTEGVSGLSKAIFKLASPTGIAVTAAGVLVGLGIAFKKAKEDAIKANIAEHFGDIKLSAEEVEDVAKRLTTTDWTMKLDLYSNAKAELDDTMKSLEGAKATLEKETWMIRLGVKLSKSDIEDYTAAIDNYIRSAIGTVEQANYTAQVSIDAVLIPGTTANRWVSEFSQNFYSEADAELTKLGSDLAQLVDDSLGDNILTNEELININEIQRRMQAILDKISERQYQVELEKIKIGSKGDSLSPESFQSLIDEINEQTQERLSSIQGIQAETTVDLKAMLSNGQISKSTFDMWTKQAELSVAGNTAEITIPAVDVLVDTINTNWDREIEQAMEACKFNIDQVLSKNEIMPTDDWQKELADSLTAGLASDNWQKELGDSITAGLTSVSDDTAGAMKGFVEGLAPQRETLESLKEQYAAVGAIPPESITDALNDIYRLEQISGAADNTMNLLAQAIAESPGKYEAIINSSKTGEMMDKALAEALEENYGLVWNATAGMFEQTKQSSFLSQAEAIEYMNTAGLEQGSSFATSIASQYGLVYDSTAKMWTAIEAAAANSNISSSMKEKGVEAGAAQAQGVAEGAASQGENVQLSGAEVIESSQAGMESALPAAEEAATDGGISIGTALAEGISNTEPAVDESATALAKSAAQEMQSTISSITLSPPKMAAPDWTESARQGRASMQAYLNNNSLSIAIRTAGSSLPEHGSGGIYSTPHVAIVAEEAPGESIIPLSAARRSAALELMDETARIIGYGPYSYAADAGRGTSTLHAAQTNSNAKPSSVDVVFEEGAITIKAAPGMSEDGLYNLFKQRLQRDVERMAKGHGGI